MGDGVGRVEGGGAGGAVGGGTAGGGHCWRMRDRGDEICEGWDWKKVILRSVVAIEGRSLVSSVRM